MADYPYSTVPGKFSEFLAKIQQIGVPDKVTTRWLPTIGFGSANDRSIIKVIKFVGLVNDAGNPSDVWREFRGPGGSKALGNAVRAAYSDLFTTYPDAPNRTSEELKAFFRGHSSYGSQGIDKAVATFKVLCQHSEFGEAPKRAPRDLHEDSSGHESVDPAMSARQPTSKHPSLHVDIQIHISPEASSDQIEKIFESMAKHLYGKE